MKTYKVDVTATNKEEIDLNSFELTSRRKVVLLIVVIAVAILAYGILTYGWYAEEICGMFFAMAVVAGLYYNRSLGKTVDTFMAQAGTMAQAAILLALSKSILVVLSEGQLIDTIVHALATPLGQLNGVIAAWMLYLANLVINFFIPSSSGQAMVVMPLLTPLADLTGLTRQVVVHAFMSADSFGNMIIPTHPTTLACLGIAGISYNKWFKLAWPLVAIWTLISFGVLAVGVMINWGPC